MLTLFGCMYFFIIICIYIYIYIYKLILLNCILNNKYKYMNINNYRIIISPIKNT